MDTKDLRSFLKTYELKSITKASQHLYITPQGLSKTIIKLENELNAKLFTRTSFGVVPTQYAERLAKISDKIINKLDSIKYEVLKEDNKVTLNIAATYGILAYLSLDFINEFKRSYPDIHLNIVELPDKQIEDLILKEAVDLAFLTGPINTTKFESVFFTSHHHCLVFHKSHKLTSKEFIEYTDLNNEPLILMGRDFTDYHNNMNRFLKAGATPNVIMETSEIYLTHILANENKAVGLSVDFLAFDNPYPNTVIKQFSDQNCTWDTYLVFKKNIKPKEEALILRNFSLQWIQSNKDLLFHWNK